MNTLNHRVDGSADLPPLILGPSLGTSLAIWDPQVPALARSRHVIRYDLPGHGGSPSGLLPATGATIADVGRLVLGLADSLGIDRFAYAGISVGGAVGLWLAVQHPERIESSALICSAARFGEPGGWRARAELVREKGTSPIADTAATRWFTPAFASDPAALALVDDLRAADPDDYAALCDALSEFDMRDELPRITAPTLVIAGRDDPVITPDRARELADGIPGASLTEVAHAAHLAGVEQPGPVLAALLGQLAASDGDAARYAAVGDAFDLAASADDAFHLAASADDASRHAASADDASRHAAGMTVRRAVLGDAHVDRAVAGTTAFTAAFQDFITRYAWGEIWTRPGLSRQTRSCITITALVALGHHEELAMHVRAALRNGLTPDEIGEVLLQSAVYCGVPAANAAFAVADRVLQDVAKEAEEEEH